MLGDSTPGAVPIDICVHLQLKSPEGWAFHPWVGSFPRALPEPRHHEVTAQRLSKTTLWGPDAQAVLRLSEWFLRAFLLRSILSRTSTSKIFWNKPFLIERCCCRRRDKSEWPSMVQYSAGGGKRKLIWHGPSTIESYRCSSTATSADGDSLCCCFTRSW